MWKGFHLKWLATKCLQKNNVVVVNLLVPKEEVDCEAYHIPFMIQMMEGETIEVHHHQGGQEHP